MSSLNKYGEEWGQKGDDEEGQWDAHLGSRLLSICSVPLGINLQILGANIKLRAHL
jgi:hypothetical protein